MKQVRLNRAEVWIADHALPIFAVVALAIVVGAVAIVTVFFRADSAQDQVNVLRPQVTTINRAICDARSLESEDRARRCAERIRVGLVNCRRYSRCRAAFIAALTYPPPARGATSPAPGSGDTSRPPAPSTDDGSSSGPRDTHEPSPGSHGDGNGGHGKGPKQPAGGAPAAPAAPEGSEAPEPSPGGQKAPETGGDGAEQGDEDGQGGDQGGSSSGVGVELCVLEGTCVGLGVDVLPKGLTVEPPIRREGATQAAPEAAPPAP